MKKRHGITRLNKHLPHKLIDPSLMSRYIHVQFSFICNRENHGITLPVNTLFGCWENLRKENPAINWHHPYLAYFSWALHLYQQSSSFSVFLDFLGHQTIDRKITILFSFSFLSFNLQLFNLLMVGGLYGNFNRRLIVWSAARWRENREVRSLVEVMGRAQILAHF